jgi:NAD(P)H-hydrate epimerase
LTGDLMHEPKKVVTAAEMMSIENRWFDSGAIDLEALMNRVGREIADWVLEDIRDSPSTDSHVLALVGKGNNGGDALVAARHLLVAGIDSTVALVLPRDENDRLVRGFQAAGGSVVILQGESGLRKLSNLCDKTGLILDGVFGFNISRPIGEPISTMFSIVKSSGKKVVAIDLPSGADPDTGEFDPGGLPADACLPVGLQKLGPAIRFGDECYGDETNVLDVAIPPELTRHIKREVNDFGLARGLLPDRDATAHKGTFGRSLLICGSKTYVGAASLAVRACLRSGVGLVALATPESVYRALAGNVPEATYIPLDEDAEGVLPDPAFQQIGQHVPTADSVLIGVGISRSSGARELMSSLTTVSDIWEGRTVVIDADGLTLISELSNWWEVFNGNLIITPHPGEMSRLLSMPVSEVEADRRAAVEMAAERFNCIAILKGTTTLIASPDGQMRINMMPNHGLARGGSGDVLAGLVTGLCARSNPFDAASLGVFLHSLSGKSAREQLTPYAMTAGDLLAHLPNAFRALASWRKSSAHTHLERGS